MPARAGIAISIFQWTGRALVKLWPALALTAIFLIANKQLVCGKAVLKWDAHSFYTSQQILLANSLRAGKLLMWDPWANAGSPDYLDPNNGAQSPFCILACLIGGGTEAAYRWHFLLTWLAAGLGMQVLTRSLGTPPWGAFVVSCGFTFSGFLTGHAEHMPIIHAFAALPWILWRWDVSLRGGGLRPAVEAGALWGLSALAGYPGQIVIHACVILFWALGRVLFPRCLPVATGTPTTEALIPPLRIRSWRAASTCLVLFAVGGVVLCPLYYAFLTENKGYSDRSGPLPRDFAINSNALHPKGLVSAVSPFLPLIVILSSPPQDHYGTDVSSVSIYSGVVVTWLAFAALLIRPTSGWRWWLVGLAVLGGALAVGSFLPFRGWAYDFLPPFRYFRHSALFRELIVFTVCLLAASACVDLQDLMRRLPLREDATLKSPARQWTALKCLAAALVVGGGALAIYRILFVRWGLAAVSTNLPADIKRYVSLHPYLCWISILIPAAFTFIRPGLLQRCLLPIGLVLVAGTDALLTSQISHYTVWTPVLPGTLHPWDPTALHYRASLDLKPNGLQRGTLNPPFVCNLNLVSKTCSISSLSANRNSYHQAWTLDPVLVASATGSDRSWFAPSREVAQVHILKSSFAAFQQRSHTLGAIPLVIHDPVAILAPSEHPVSDAEGDAEALQIQNLPAARRVPVDLEKYLPDHLSFSVDVPEAGYLLVTDRWARGWKVNVNGRSTQVLCGDFLFRVVPVEAGRNRIQFDYRPAGYPWLLLLSWGTLVAVGLWSCIAGYRATASDKMPPTSDHCGLENEANAA